MRIEYTNRKGKLYFLHIGKTKKGNDKYFFSSDQNGNLAQGIPKGYEIYENVNAQVFLTKIQERIIKDEELNIIKEELQKHTKPYHYRYEAKKNIITVYEICQDLEGISAVFPFADKSKIENHIVENATYLPIMRFILKDKEKRLFSTERFCFMGGIDDWIYIGGADLSLINQANKYIKHLGKESFYELS